MSTSQPREPYASTEDLEAELDGEHTPEQLQKWLRRAVSLITQRIPNEDDESHLRELEVLVGAHFAYPTVIGSTGGRQLSTVEQESSRLTFETTSSAPGEYSSPYWDQAVLLDPRLTHGPSGAWTVSVG